VISLLLISPTAAIPSKCIIRSASLAAARFGFRELHDSCDSLNETGQPFARRDISFKMREFEVAMCIYKTWYQQARIKFQSSLLNWLSAGFSDSKDGTIWISFNNSVGDWIAADRADQVG
jgi:hypothetical protein